MVLLVVGAWAYLFIFGAPEKTDDVFAKFGFGGNSEVTDVIPYDDSYNDPVDDTPRDESTNNMGQGALVKLATRAVAGASFSSGGVRFAEQGTGHIYEIPSSGGAESELVGTTRPRIVRAVFSLSGSRVALMSEDSENNIFVGTITKNDSGLAVIDGTEKTGDAYNVAFSPSGDKLYYVEHFSSESVGYAYDLVNESEVVLFRIPLTQVTILWGETIYALTRPAASLLGNVYKIKGNSLEYVRNAGFGLMALPYSGGMITTESSERKLASRVLKDGTSEKLNDVVFGEKCIETDDTSEVILCGVPSQLSAGTLPDDWYKGVTSFSDQFWLIDLNTLSSEFVIEPETIVRETIDVASIVRDTTGDQFLIINKTDDSLWLLDTTMN